MWNAQSFGLGDVGQGSNLRREASEILEMVECPFELFESLPDDTSLRINGIARILWLFPRQSGHNGDELGDMYKYL